MGEVTDAEGRRFDHERLEVYRVAVEFAAWERGMARSLSKGNGDLADQIDRAAASIALNIAEGCGKFSAAERLRFYRMARRSATECAAGLDLLEAAAGVPAGRLSQGRALVARVIAMLSVLTRRP